MKKKIAVLAVGVVLSFGLLTGCGKPTVEKLVEGMYKEEVTSQTTKANFDVDLGVTLQGADYSIKLDGTVDSKTEMDGDDTKTYANCSVNYNIFEFMKNSVNVEAYVMQNADSVDMYYCDPTDGNWYVTKQALADEGVSVDKETLKAVTEESKNVWLNAELAEDLTEKCGEDCYVLTLNSSLKDFLPVANVMMQSADLQDKWEEAKTTISDTYGCTVDELLDYIKVDMTGYVSKKSGLLVASSVDLSNMDLVGLMDTLGLDINDLTSSFGVSIDGISVNKLTFDLEMTDVNKTTVELSDDAAAAEEKTVELPTNGLIGSDDASYDEDADFEEYDDEVFDEEYDLEEYDDEDFEEEDFEEEDFEEEEF